MTKSKSISFREIENRLTVYVFCGIGLDPTIFFYMNGNRSMDLDETDAHFVDVIHTGAGILGQWGPNGHADFYVNGGSSQPGCATSSLLREYDRQPFFPSFESFHLLEK